MYFDESETAYMFVRRACATRRSKKVAQYVKKLVREEAKIANKLKFRFSQPMAIDFVNVLTDMMGIEMDGKPYRRIMRALKRLTTVYTIDAKPSDMAVRAILTYDPTMKEAADALVSCVV
jgi:hypothetical protein